MYGRRSSIYQKDNVRRRGAQSSYALQVGNARGRTRSVVACGFLQVDYVPTHHCNFVRRRPNCRPAAAWLSDTAADVGAVGAAAVAGSQLRPRCSNGQWPCPYAAARLDELDVSVQAIDMPIFSLLPRLQLFTHAMAGAGITRRTCPKR